ncbi:MAG: hypothetical protein HN849_04260 [Victivallales bacterium]|nr:hypothetical protein [Victivallales bacterium]
MVSEEYDAVMDEAVMDLESILADYRRRQRIEALIGPIISALFHVVVLVSAYMIFTGKVVKEVRPLEANVEELEVKELDEKEFEELEDIEEIVEEVVPTVEKPEIPAEVAEVTTDDINEEMLAAAENEMDFSDVLNIKESSTPLKMAALFGSRSGSGRADARRKHGGDRMTETSVLRALRWLKMTQNPDGSWSKTQPETMAGLGLLTFLAHGETPGSEEFGLTVQKAIKYLSDKVTAYRGDPKANLHRAYVNGIVTYALSEAYGVTKLPYVKPPMEKGLARVVQGQQPAGGYDYHYAKGSRWDLSVVGWQVQALKAGFVAGTENEAVLKALKKAQSFLQEVNFKNGKFGYGTPGVGSAGMQGAGTLCLQLIGEGHSKEARAGVKWIKENDEVKWDRRAKYSAHSNPVYNWYYETQAMFHAGKSNWNRWNKQMKRQLASNQRVGKKTADGKATGYWEAPGRWDKPEYDKWYNTTLCALSLQVYYRYLPTYKMPKKTAKAEKTILDEIDIDIEME